LFEDDQDDDQAVITFQGASIGVRAATGVAATHDKLYIDELTVNAADMRSFMGHIDTAIGTMNGKLNDIGINQRSLSGKEVNLTEAITANSAARSRIMDTDFAKEQSNSIRLQILQQTATAALSQANMGPQAVLGFLG
jgi:flagellin